MKSPVAKIEIQRAEGPNSADFSLKTVPNFDAAFALLIVMGRTAPEPEKGGYDKTDFTVFWENGEAYKGRFDLQRGGCDAGQTLQEHVHDALTFYAGLRCPEHMDEAKYRAMLSRSPYKEMVPEAKKMLETLEI